MAEIGQDIAKAKALLEEGKLVAIPTETVYGLAGNAYNLDAIANIFSTKNRPGFDPLIVHISDYETAKSISKNIPEKAKVLADKFWPGPLTLLLEKQSSIPDLVTSGLNTVGIRLPQQRLTLELLSALEFPLVAPSANPFGYVSPTTAQHVNDQLGDKIDYILDGGECNIGIESTIIGFGAEPPTIHRLGGIAIEEIEALIGSVEVQTHSNSNPKAPGMLASHYSPSKKILLGNINDLIEEFKSHNFAILSFEKSYNQFLTKTLAPDGKVETAAKNLFAYLRWLDRQDIDIIIAEKAPEIGLGRAINDRLKRAAAQ